jgi:hypothetical protein
MKARSIIYSALISVAATGAAFTTGTAFAQHSPFQSAYGQARLIPVGASIEIGVHNDRYWDGHRYWAHDEWRRDHPRDRDPWLHEHERRIRHHRDDDEPHRY